MKSQRHRLVGTLGRIGLLLVVLLGLLAPGAPAAPAALAAEGPGDTAAPNTVMTDHQESMSDLPQEMPALSAQDDDDPEPQVNTCCGYSSPGNPFPCDSARNNGNCTWWAFHKRPDVPPACWKNADLWADCMRDHGYRIDNIPAVGALIVYPNSNGTYAQHVAYIEDVHSVDSIWVDYTISQMSWGVNGERNNCNDNTRNGTPHRVRQRLAGVEFIHALGDVDAAPPIITITFDPIVPVEVWRTNPFTLQAGATDNVAVNQITITVSLNSAVVYSETVDGSTLPAMTFGADGLYEIEVKASDAAGNVGTSTTTTKLDTTPPALAIDAADPGPGLSLVASDALAGLASREISLDGGATWLPYAEPLPAAKALLLRATDNAGNQALVAAQLRHPADSADWWERRISGARYRDVPDTAGGVIGVRGAALVSVVGGRAYTFGAAVITSDPATQASITVFWLDAQGRLLERDDTASPIGATGRFERTVRAPAGAAFAQIDLRGHGVGQIWIDDLTLAGADGLSLLPSGAFNAEDAAAWRTLRYLDRLGTAELRDHPAAGPALALTLRPTWTSPESRLIASQNPRVRAGGELRHGAAFAVRPGAAYELALAIQGAEVTGRATLELRFYDPQGNLIGTEVTGAPQGSFGWQWLRVAVEAPAGAASARAALTLEGEGRLWLDTLTLIGH